MAVERRPMPPLYMYKNRKYQWEENELGGTRTLSHAHNLVSQKYALELTSYSN